MRLPRQAMRRPQSRAAWSLLQPRRRRDRTSRWRIRLFVLPCRARESLASPLVSLAWPSAFALPPLSPCHHTPCCTRNRGWPRPQRHQRRRRGSHRCNPAWWAAMVARDQPTRRTSPRHKRRRAAAQLLPRSIVTSAIFRSFKGHHHTCLPCGRGQKRVK